MNLSEQHPLTNDEIVRQKQILKKRLKSRGNYMLILSPLTVAIVYTFSPIIRHIHLNYYLHTGLVIIALATVVAAIWMFSQIKPVRDKISKAIADYEPIGEAEIDKAFSYKQTYPEIKDYFDKLAKVGRTYLTVGEYNMISAYCEDREKEKERIILAEKQQKLITGQ